MSSAGPGGPILPAGLRAGAETRLGHRDGDRGSGDAPLARLDDGRGPVPRREGPLGARAADAGGLGGGRGSRGGPPGRPSAPVLDIRLGAGPPDLILKVSEPYALGGSGPDEYRVFVLPSGLSEGRWIGEVDFQPGNRKVVHHILAAYDVTGRARELDAAD